MREYRHHTARKLAACICDRCQRRVTTDEPGEWQERLSFNQSCGFGSRCLKPECNSPNPNTWPAMPNILVIDLEATCDENAPSFDMETIEVGGVWAAGDGSVLDCFQAFVRPVVNPGLTPFCLALTGIRQADVDNAPTFPAVAEALRVFVARHQEPGARWVSWGAWDNLQVLRDCERHGIAPPIDLPHVNAKRLFAKARHIGKQVGMAKACELVGLRLEGMHHRALDDALNVARLLPWVLEPHEQ